MNKLYAVGDVLFSKVAKNPTPENIEKIVEINKDIITSNGFEESRPGELAAHMKRILIWLNFRNWDPQSMPTKLTDRDIVLLKMILLPEIEFQDLISFKIDENENLVAEDGQICEVVAARIVFGKEHHPMMFLPDEFHAIKNIAIAAGLDPRNVAEFIYFRPAEKSNFEYQHFSTYKR